MSQLSANRIEAAHEAEPDIRNVPREVKKRTPRFEYPRLVVENDTKPSVDCDSGNTN
jgi:hypothetical protein